mgnify:CR=1 FL=1
MPNIRRGIQAAVESLDDSPDHADYAAEAILTSGGVSVGVTATLAGTPKADMVAKMQDFKAGRRPGTIMPQLAKGYTDEQIDLVAGWFAAQKAK